MNNQFTQESFRTNTHMKNAEHSIYEGNQRNVNLKKLKQYNSILFSWNKQKKKSYNIYEGCIKMKTTGRV